MLEQDPFLIILPLWHNQYQLTLKKNVILLTQEVYFALEVK